MGFSKVCRLDEVPDDDMVSFFVMDYLEVLILRDSNGTLHAFQGLCPHEDYPLVDGIFDGATITCCNHGWIFNAETGRGINPSSCRIAEYPLRVEEMDVLVDIDHEIG